jgi:transglutaminase-like putative cysteine protease
VYSSTYIWRSSDQISSSRINGTKISTMSAFFVAAVATISLLSLPLLPVDAYLCEGNTTHIAWGMETSIERKKRELSSSSSLLKENVCEYELHNEAEQAALKYLRRNVMAFDLLKLETLGFASGDSSEDIDGLSSGIVGPSVTMALAAKQNYTWTNALPKKVFYEYVLNYANTNEARTNWRPLLASVVEPLLKTHQAESASDVVKILNTHIWTELAPKHSDSIDFVSGQTPLIYDPMSVIAFGYASCTGLAILFVNTLRAAGVAARVVGTPAWHDNREDGNHNWVEVYDNNGEWKFMEPSPKQATIDTLERDPCKRWFCQKDRFPGTPVYAARLDQASSYGVAYPLAWEWNCTTVPGVDRTAYYADVCSKC